MMSSGDSQSSEEDMSNHDGPMKIKSDNTHLKENLHLPIIESVPNKVPASANEEVKNDGGPILFRQQSISSG